MKSHTTLLSMLILASASALLAAPAAKLSYPVVDTGQTRCYDSTKEIAYPKTGAAYAGQDAQYSGNAMRYTDNKDGTITDEVTGLIWEKTPDFKKRSWPDAAKHANALNLGGKTDWRMPTMKELFSIAHFEGNQHTKTPYLHSAFDFHWPTEADGGRDMDGQYWSSNKYLGTTMRSDQSAFGFNFADGRIKGYPVSGRKVGTLFLRCVRGKAYGENKFVDNKDGTISDNATGLIWTQKTSAKSMDWPAALKYAEGRSFAGQSDWRLPNIKELQTLVDYDRAPDAKDKTKRGPAIDPIFKLTDNSAWCWSSTTHLETRGAYYVCFGKALSEWTYNGQKMDAHGAGAVRSDPKTGDASRFSEGHGPQGDQVRIKNYVLLVRGGAATPKTTGPKLLPASSTQRRRPQGGNEPQRPAPDSDDPRISRFINRLDKNNDGKVSKAEFDGPSNHFGHLDKNSDGFISSDEAPSGPPQGGPPRRR
ncbi:MAG: DUF1566 domain-containing protein [Phycisphaerales bacterium]|jgi:hypothetical protein|nr:DUF1566 domain-containing protein [Phycisphaerales bacterium]MBT7171305.1 DUF1566 domain-containing protein [Phycisphaerales bacterium]